MACWARCLIRMRPFDRSETHRAEGARSARPKGAADHRRFPTADVVAKTDKETAAASAPCLALDRMAPAGPLKSACPRTSEHEPNLSCQMTRITRMRSFKGFEKPIASETFRERPMGAAVRDETRVGLETVSSQEREDGTITLRERGNPDDREPLPCVFAIALVRGRRGALGGYSETRQRRTGAGFPNVARGRSPSMLKRISEIWQRSMRTGDGEKEPSDRPARVFKRAAKGGSCRQAESAAMLKAGKAISSPDGWHETVSSVREKAASGPVPCPRLAQSAAPLRTSRPSPSPLACPYAEPRLHQ